MTKYSLLFIVVIFFGCQLKETKTVEHGNASLVFDFDEVVHYQTDITDSQLRDLFQKEEKKLEVKQFEDILTSEGPEKISDKNFIVDINLNYPLKTKIENRYFNLIKDFYTVRPHREVEVNACAPIYRDILIFKKKGKILGVSKICFQCGIQQTIGSLKNTENLAQNGDWNELKRALKIKEDINSKKIENQTLLYDTLEFNKDMKGKLLSEKFKSSQSELGFYEKFIKNANVNKEITISEKHTKTKIKYLGKIVDLKTHSSYHIITNFSIMGIGQMLSPRGRSEVAFVDETQNTIIIYNFTMPDELPKSIMNNALYFKYEKTNIGIFISGGLPYELCIPEIGCN
ncbi:hypothetical protein EZ428_01020 [Pedobacter frigiditerrae]|uniref:Lipoprotein n=2 Tax=Pedobacter frigiditerrae TaxID=2530452 RepID=A0A4R0N511_9SPHI|nr:hypothetical protein EZ428_01020 [Pedobacter frigiditerrae]